LTQHKYKLNTFNKKLLDCVRDLLTIESLVSEFISDGSQDSLDNLCKHIDEYDKRWDNTKMSLMPLIKMISGVETNDVDVELTENGYKL